MLVKIQTSQKRPRFRARKALTEKEIRLTLQLDSARRKRLRVLQCSS